MKNTVNALRSIMHLNGDEKSENLLKSSINSTARMDKSGNIYIEGRF